ncbi:hypothetical protein BV20DRAFT_169191 [Pilatotrama ljubarskyi]|nr:hypothetical protein BV20DRAFT_169191 [Pilatotrama ljubarskyi]
MSGPQLPHPALRRAVEDWAQAGLIDIALSDIRELPGDSDIHCPLINSIPPAVLGPQLMSICHAFVAAESTSGSASAASSHQGATDNSEPANLVEVDKGNLDKEIYDLVASASTCTRLWETRQPGEHFPWISVFTRILRVCFADRVVLRRDCEYVKPREYRTSPQCEQDVFSVAALLVSLPLSVCDKDVADHVEDVEETDETDSPRSGYRPTRCSTTARRVPRLLRLCG